jgi:hypothetical protein
MSSTNIDQSKKIYLQANIIKRKCDEYTAVAFKPLENTPRTSIK